MIPTNRGPMAPEQILDELTYISYATNRDLGLSAKSLAGFFGEIPSERMEARYRAEQRAA